MISELRLDGTVRYQNECHCQEQNCAYVEAGCEEFILKQCRHNISYHWQGWKEIR